MVGASTDHGLQRRLVCDSLRHMDEARLALIRFVALRYRPLQGFRTASDGVFLLLMPLVFRWDGHGALRPGDAVGGTILFVAAASLVQHFVGVRYDRRFG